jgi:hypothetical protein
MGRQGDRFHRHQELAGPAFSARHPDRAQSLERAGLGGAPEGAFQLCLSFPSRTYAAERPHDLARRRWLSTRNFAFHENHLIWRQGRVVQSAGERVDLEPGHVHARHLFRRRMSVLPGLLRHEGAQGSTAGRCSGGQSSFVLRRRRFEGHRRGRVATDRQYRDLRRGASVAGNRDHVLRRYRVDVAGAGAVSRCVGRRPVACT